MPPRAGRSKLGVKLLALAISASLAVLCFEVGARVLLWALNDRNPYYLVFGFAHDPSPGTHAELRDGYSKFTPGVTKWQKEKERTLEIQINANGFRGARDFESPKPAGRYRIAALGGSSTFGYHNADDETWPVQLERLLRRAYPDRDVEVMNFGMPHARTDHIVALARAELPPLEPDLLLLYAGWNDASSPEGPAYRNRVYGLKDWLFFHSTGYRLVAPVLKQTYYGLAGRMGADPVGLPTLILPVLRPPEEVLRLRTEITERVVGNVEQLLEAARELDAELMLVSQSATLRFVRTSSLFGETNSYADEIEIIERALDESGGIPGMDAALLVHRDVQRSLRALAEREELGFADGLSRLEADRGLMRTYVHLKPLGNLWLAETIRDAIVSGGYVVGSSGD